MHILSVQRHFMELCMVCKIKNLLWKKSSLASKSTNTFNWNLLNKHDLLECWKQCSSPTNGKYGCVKWNYFTKPLFQQPFFGRAICGNECTRPRNFVAYFWRVSVVQDDAWDLHWRPICLPSPDSESSRHTDQTDGEKQAGGMVLGSAWTCLDSMLVMTVLFLGLFKGQ